MPIDEYFVPSKDMHFNGEAVVLYHEPNAHTDGDSFVLFRGSDVISAGDVFTPGSYPFIDIANGGSVQGEIAALNHLLQLTVPAHTQEGGTYVVPGHGRLSRRGGRRRVPRHDRHRPRPRAGHDQERDDARPDQGRAAVARLRSAVRHATRAS